MPSSPPQACPCGATKPAGQPCPRCGRGKRTRKPSRFRDPKLYGRRWHEASLRYRAENPLCVMCRDEGRTVAAECVDHVTPHRGNVELFWDQSNWMALCFRHHNAKSAKEMHE